MSRCFFVHEPPRIDGESVPVSHVTAASLHGEPFIVLPAVQRPNSDLDQYMPTLRHWMETYASEDYIVLTGYTPLIIAACVLAAKAADGRISLLRWDAKWFRYVRVDQIIFAPARRTGKTWAREEAAKLVQPYLDRIDSQIAGQLTADFAKVLLMEAHG